MSDQELHRTVLSDSGDLSVKVEVVTYSEHHTEKDSEWWHIYSQPKMVWNMMPDVVMQLDPVYLSGTVKGVRQKIKLEMPSPEAVDGVSEHYHNLMVEMYRDHVPMIQAKVLMTLAEKIK